MTYRNGSVLLLLVAVVSLVVGCGSATDGTGGGSQYAIPSGSQDIMSDEELAYFQDKGFVINEGTNPPDIEGSYEMADSVVTFDESGQHTGRGLYTYVWEFSNQNEDAVEVAYSTNAGDEASGIGGFISGQGDCFTVMSRLEGESETSGCVFHRVHMFSGCVTENSIDDFQTAYHTRHPGEGPEGAQCEEHDEPRRMSEETDGLIDRL